MAAPVLTPVVATRPDGVTSRTELSEQAHEVDRLPVPHIGLGHDDGQRRSLDPDVRPDCPNGHAHGPGRPKVDGGLRRRRAARPPDRPGVRPLAFTYDAQGRESSETVGSGCRQQRTRFSYDASTGRITITRPDGSVDARRRCGRPGDGDDGRGRLDRA